MSIDSVKGFTACCRDCKWYMYLGGKHPAGDGECTNIVHAGKGRKTPYRVDSRNTACFDAEEKESFEQMEMEV